MADQPEAGVIDHLDEPHPLADLMAVVERVRRCTCYDRTCDYCRDNRGRDHGPTHP